MISFCYIVHELLAGIASATAQESDPEIKGKIQTIQIMPVISWRPFGEGDSGSLKRWRRCLPRTPSPVSRPAAPLRGAGSTTGTAEGAWRPAASGAGVTAPVSEGSSRRLIPDEAKHTIEASLAEDPTKGLASNAPEVNSYKFRSGDVVGTLEKLFLRCRVLSSLLNASLCMCRPSQGEMWPMCPLMSVVGRPYGQHTQAVVAKRRMANIGRP